MEIKPKKSLGQNFLRDEKVLQKIIEVSELNSEDFVIEIGPGEGVLTEQLAKYVKKVVAIEIDPVLSNLLSNKFSNKKNVEIIHADILKINLPELIANQKLPASTRGDDRSSTRGWQATNYKLIANIPYYITSPIIRLFLEQPAQPQAIFLMIQKEVAERIVASPSEIPADGRDAKRISRGKKGQMSILSVSIQYYATAEIMFTVDKKAFFPVPKVDSALIKIIPAKKFDKDQDKDFFRIVKAGFSAKRKTLLNNLSSSLQLDKNSVEEKLKTIGISPIARAQELDVEDWKKLTTLFHK